MFKGEPICVEQLPVVQIAFSIQGVSNHWAAYVFEVDADLVGASCTRSGKYETCFISACGHLDFSDCFTPIRKRCHLFSVNRVAANGCVDDGIDWTSMANSEIEFLHFSRGKKFNQLLVRLECFGGDEDACCVFVEAVDNARSEWVGAGGDVFAMVQERVHKSA
jgi:hypothetical protein